VAFFGNRRKDFSIQPPKQSTADGILSVTDSANIDFTYALNNLTANLTQLLPISGTYGDATNIPVLQIDQFGRVTGVTTVAIGGGGGTYTVNNGLTESPANNFQLGGPTLGSGNLIRDTYITNDGYTFRIDQTGAATNALYLSHLGTGLNVGTGLRVAVADGRSIRATSTGGIAFEGVTQLDYTAELIRNAASTNNIEGIIRLNRSSTGVPGGGIGGSIDFWIEERQTIPAPIPTDPTVRLAGLWENPGPAVLSRLSRFDIYGYSNGGTLLNASVRGDGKFILRQYGINTFAGTPAYALGVDASGNVVEFTGGGGGSSLNDTTGILFGGALSATIGGTTFSVTAGIGQIVTQTASISGVVTTASNVTWSAVTGAAITNIGTSQFTYVLVNSSGVVIQQTTPFTDAQYKTHIIIGILCHIDFASVNLVTNSQNVAYEDPHRLVELISAFGPIKKSGLNIGPNGANLRVNRTSGEAFKIGTNYILDQFEPDVAIIAAQTPALLCRVHRDGSGGFIFDVNGGSYYNNIDPDKYDNGSGTLQSVGGSKWTIQRLFFFPNNPVDIICYYGTQVYNQFSEARANLEFETFDEATITAENAVFLGFLFVRNAATNLSLATQAAFLQSGLFRGIPPGGGGSGGGGNSIGELTGDVTTPAATAPSQSVAATIANNAVTYAKMQAISATSRLLGSSSTTTPVQEITLGTNLSMSGTTLNATGGGITALTGDVTASGTGSVAATLAASYKAGSAGVIFDGAGGVIATNTIGYVQVPYNGDITGWQIVANAIGACTITVRKGTFPPTSIIISPSPAMPGGTQTSSATITPIAVAAGEWLSFTISGVSTVAWVNLTLSITKTI
jgi:hypothetical protein